MGLNSKQKLFVKHYRIHQNATKAAKAAGYSKKTSYSIGQRLLKNVEIRKMLKDSAEKTSAKLDISAERILGRIAEMAFDTDWIKKSDILRACELLGKHKSLFTENINMNANVKTDVVLHLYENGSEAPLEKKKE